MPKMYVSRQGSARRTGRAHRHLPSRSRAHPARFGGILSHVHVIDDHGSKSGLICERVCVYCRCYICVNMWLWFIVTAAVTARWQAYGASGFDGRGEVKPGSHGVLVALLWLFVTQAPGLAAAESVDVLLQVVVSLIACSGTRPTALPVSTACVSLCSTRSALSAVLLRPQLCSESLSGCPQRASHTSALSRRHHGRCCCDHPPPHHPPTHQRPC